VASARVRRHRSRHPTRACRLFAGGLLVAAVIKYGDNILKNFTTSCSVILGTLISVVLFDFQLSYQFLWGSALVVSSAYVYATAPPSTQAASPPKRPPVKDENVPLQHSESSDDSDKT
jgi:UDP-sugar transporter A1/2/3